MSAGVIARAAAWLVLLLAGGLGLDGVDRYQRLKGLSTELASAERAATASRPPATGGGRSSPLPDAADDSDALRPLRTIPTGVVFDPDVRDRLYSAHDTVSDDGGRTWRPMSADDLADRESATVRPSIGPGGGVLISGVEAPRPGRVSGLTRALDGTVYARVTDTDRFSLWFTNAASEPWRPIGGAGPFNVMAPGEPGVLYVAGLQLGCWRANAWTRTDWPDQFAATGLRAHPRAPLVVALGSGALAISRDGGRTLRRVRFANRSVAWVALDPFQAEHVLVGDPSGAVFALELGRLR